ncbi:Histone deacetylase complex, subunit 2/3 [Penicillium expansum]|uniref:Histone deacetylase complex, subunit 2/3 n=1 Tax=Penicillium expansum TaxID=27334 RepID=A0A0A2KVT6_PENEN|nr:Histone deacetylase complex, subunit 2/3 [Penicillium expansum]KGO43373.1 Histone deacetylase complex, subunit 2/3 [Penicillium expansum]KGO57401.1 Histone deacetylase complex, subunit 2/3 [Penicillium expansum]KGO71028.1 Histone deacetylase complex, subunit 2/3 [Penicillium expansum]
MLFREQPHPPNLDSHHRKNTDRLPAAIVVISDSSESSDGSDSDDQEWPIKCILRETDTEYLIDWEGPYDPTWEPKENASELAIQVWNKRKARRSNELDWRSTRERVTQSPSIIEVSSSSSEANIGLEDRYSTSFDDESDAHSDNRPRASSSLFVRQEGLSEIIDSLQSQYIKASGCFYGTASPSQSLSDCSPPLAALSTSTRSQPDATLFEYIPESSIPPEDLQPGEWDDVNTQQPDPTCDLKGDSVDSCSSYRQYSGEINNAFEFSYPNTPGLGLSSKVSEIAETPAQPPGSGADSLCLGSFPLDNTLSHNNLTSQHLLLCGPIARDCEFAQSTYLSSIPETVFHHLSQHPESLGSEGSTRPVLSFSNIVEQERSTEIMEDKEPKLSDHSLSDATVDRYSQLPGSTPTEKMQNAWAQLSQENQSDLSRPANAVETPSSVGDIEASIPLSVPDTTAPLSVRPDTDSFSHSHTAVHHGHSEPLLPPSELAHGGHLSQPSLQTIHPSALTVTGMDDEVAPGSVHLGPSEFAVTLPMDSRVKDDYERVLSDAATSIRQFFDSFQSNTQISEPEREVLHSHMREVIRRLSNVSTHPDLNISDHLKDADPDLAKEASWAEYSSAKFLLLGHLMEIVGTNELHLILAVQDEKKQAVVERYLQGKGFTYTRPRGEMGSTLEVSLAKGSLSFGIHSSETARELYKPPSAIFALDSYFRPKSPSMQHLRTTYARNGNLLPVIWFLVANTSEHIERCLPDSPEPDRLRLLVHYIARLHDEVGDLQDDALGVHEDAEEILGYLLDSVAGWPLPTIEPLNLVSLEELECYSPSSDDAMPPAQKRTLDEEPEEHSSKRARVGTQENSQLTESTKPPSQTLDRDLQSLEKNLIQMKHIYASEKAQLQAELAEANSRFQEMEKALGVLQHRYESRTNELHATRQERDRVTETKPSLEQRVEKQKETISSLKEERAELKRELDEARQALKNGGGSSAELETAREEIRRLAKENSNLERKAEFEKNQSEYTREQYQTASTAAAQSGTENRHLSAENEKLKRKAESNAVQLRELHMKDESARHLARIEELELTLATRDEFLRRKEDELREIRKNRPSTRSTSTQPRSPKWASSRPTSPGIGHNGNGNGGLGGRGSALRYSSEMPF